MRIFRPLLTLSVLIGGVHSAAWACSCGGQTFEEYFEGADQVVYGQVVDVVDDIPSHYDEEIPTGGCNSSTYTVTRQRQYQSSSDPVTISIEVYQSYKGNAEPGDIIEVGSVRGDSSCGLGAEIGEDWLVYDADGRTGSCTGSGEIADPVNHPALEALDAMTTGE